MSRRQQILEQLEMADYEDLLYLEDELKNMARIRTGINKEEDWIERIIYYNLCIL